MDSCHPTVGVNGRAVSDSFQCHGTMAAVPRMTTFGLSKSVEIKYPIQQLTVFNVISTCSLRQPQISLSKASFKTCGEELCLVRSITTAQSCRAQNMYCQQTQHTTAAKQHRTINFEKLLVLVIIKPNYKLTPPNFKTLRIVLLSP